MNLFLSHNPYKIETVCKIDDKLCDAPWFKQLTENRGVPLRLQMWITQFFGELRKTFPSVTDFYIKFVGTANDGEDVYHEACQAEERLGAKFHLDIECCGDPENKFETLKNLYKEAIEGPYDGFKQLELREAFKRISDRKLSVSVMAPMKNGKSTLLNAMLGQELLPNATQRCTAKISYIEHEPNAEMFEAKAIDTGNANTEYLPCSQKILEEWNKRDSVRNIYIRGQMPGIDISDYRLQFIDTPGPDSAVYKEDRITIDRFLNDNSLPMICYIVDRVNESEEHYLKRLTKYMSQFGKQSEDRFIFVVTRMDQIQVTKNDTKDSNPYKTKIQEIRDDLVRLGINNPRIFPVSSWIALKVREFDQLDGFDSGEAQDAFNSFERKMSRLGVTLMDYMDLSPSVARKLENELTALEQKLDKREDTEEESLRYIELLSGVPALELSIEEYLQKYSVPARITDAAKVFNDGIAKANAEGKLLEDIASQSTTLKEIEGKIEELRNYLSKEDNVRNFKNKFPENWTESRSLKESLDQDDREYDSRIRKKLADWQPDNIDPNGQISPEEAEKLFEEFKEFMSGISAEMFTAHSNSVESDARQQFETLKAEYERTIQDFLGEMPESLRKFSENLVFLLQPTGNIVIDMKNLIIETTEEYVEEYVRKIDIDHDGFWRTVWSKMPFTETETIDNRTVTRVIERVPFKKLKQDLKEESSVIRTEAIENARNKAKTHYLKLREAMLKEFDKVDQKLKDFSEELKIKLSNRRTKQTELQEYKKVLDGVKDFKHRLDRVLDM
jgi:predicted transposase YbfD/YdcC